MSSKVTDARTGRENCNLGVATRLVLSFLVCLVLSCVLSCLSCLVLSGLSGVLSCLVLSCVLSCLVLCLVLSCLVCLVFYTKHGSPYSKTILLYLFLFSVSSLNTCASHL